MAISRMRECVCGRKIPTDWSECGECLRLLATESIHGEDQDRRDDRRLAALLNRGWQPEAPDPNDPVMTAVEEAIARQAERKAILIRRDIHRALVSEAAVQRLYWEPDDEDS